jgi:uncharacterized protein
MKTVILLAISNVFMTFAWYGHLKHNNLPLLGAIFISWFIALFEYMFQVPANRIGYMQFSATQLKIIQEVISISVFVIFAFFYFKEVPRWNHIVSFVFILGAVYFAIGFRK